MVSMSAVGSILPSNEGQVRRGVDLVLASRRQRIGVVGLSFKAGTDDLRESPMVGLVETLIGKGCDVRILDRNVATALIFQCALLQPAIADVDSHRKSNQIRIVKLHPRSLIAIIQQRVDPGGVQLLVQPIGGRLGELEFVGGALADHANRIRGSTAA